MSRMGIGTPNSHNKAQPTLPSSSFFFFPSIHSFICSPFVGEARAELRTKQLPVRRERISEDESLSNERVPDWRDERERMWRGEKLSGN